MLKFLSEVETSLKKNPTTFWVKSSLRHALKPAENYRNNIEQIYLGFLRDTPIQCSYSRLFLLLHFTNLYCTSTSRQETFATSSSNMISKGLHLLACKTLLTGLADGIREIITLTRDRSFQPGANALGKDIDLLLDYQHPPVDLDKKNKGNLLSDDQNP